MTEPVQIKYTDAAGVDQVHTVPVLKKGDALFRIIVRDPLSEAEEQELGQGIFADTVGTVNELTTVKVLGRKVSAYGVDFGDGTVYVPVEVLDQYKPPSFTDQPEGVVGVYYGTAVFLPIMKTFIILETLEPRVQAVSEVIETARAQLSLELDRLNP